MEFEDYLRDKSTFKQWLEWKIEVNFNVYMNNICHPILDGFWQGVQMYIDRYIEIK